MKYFYSFLLLAAAAVPATAQDKFDLSARMLLQNYEQIQAGANPAIFDPRVAVPASRGGETVPEIGIIVTFNSGYSVADLAELPNVRVVVDLGDMATVSVPVTEFEKLAALPSVKNIAAGTAKQPEMCFARSIAHANEVQAGTNLPKAYSGSGIVVGMMDVGMDPNHINFTERADVNVSRVKAVYEYNNSNGIPTQTAVTPEEISKYTSDSRRESHGTHVMGIAAGSFNGLGNFGLEGASYNNEPIPYYGLATASDIVMTGGALYDANITAGVQNVIDYAKSVGKPAVVNLSLGNLMGPHDGSDAICQALARQGKDAIICVAAGNDGESACAMSMSGGRTSASRINGVQFNYDSNCSSPYVAQFWGSNNDPFVFEFVLYSTATNSVVYALEVPSQAPGGIGIGGSSMGASYVKSDEFSRAFSATSYAMFFSSKADNNRYYVQMQFLLNRPATSDYSLVPAVRISRNQGQTVTGYINTPSSAATTGEFAKSSDRIAGFDWSNTVVSSNGSISDMATANGVISVGAYTSARSFTVISGASLSYNGATNNGEMCNFTSYGTNPVTGESYPFVCAPGSAIVSSINNYNQNSTEVSATAGGNNRNNMWAVMQGTSMACPFMTGAVALWLEADNNLTVDDVKNIIRNTATPYTGSDSDMKIRWGNGKLDVLAGLKYILGNSGIAGVVTEGADMIVTPSVGAVEVFAAGAGEIGVELYTVGGALAAKTVASGDTAVLSTEGLAKGVYVLRAVADGTRVATSKIAL